MTKESRAEIHETTPPPTRADWVEQQLRRAILSGELAPGQRLYAAELTKRFAVSPTPLREALQRLSTDGLVDMTPQRGVRVSSISHNDAIEIYELRCILEPLALRKSLARKDAAWSLQVQQTYAQSVTALQETNPDALTVEKANRAFHQALLSRCESRWLLDIITTLADHCIRYRLLSFTNRGGREGVLDEHAALYTASMQGESEEAAHQLERHLRTTLESILAQFADATPATDEEKEEQTEANP